MATEKLSHAKTARKAKPSAADQAREAVAKLKQVNLEILAPAEAPEFALVPVSAIAVDDQIREAFDDGQLQELAEDISRRGVLEPLLVRRDGVRLVLIAGERRLRAARLAGLLEVPAVVRQVSAEEAKADQLAENIHRQDLSLQEEAAVVERLRLELGSLQAVAQRVHKSVVWVSKRYGLQERLGHYARRLLEDGITEDLEILRGVAQLELLSNGSNAPWALCEKIRKGEAGRSEVREAVKAAKARRDEREKPVVHSQASAPVSGVLPGVEVAKVTAPKERPLFNPEAQMWTVETRLYAGSTPEQVLSALSEKYDLVREKLEWFLLHEHYDKEAEPEDGLLHLENQDVRLLRLAVKARRGFHYETPVIVARWMGATGKDWCLEECLRIAGEMGRG